MLSMQGSGELKLYSRCLVVPGMGMDKLRGGEEEISEGWSGSPRELSKGGSACNPDVC